MSNLLVVDDDSDVRTLITFMLQQEGYTVSTATNGKEAIQKVLDTTPDLIILDLMMPVMDGFEACRQIRNLSNIPIIMLTAKDEEINLVKGLNIGADDYLVKPCQHKILLAKVKAILRRASENTIFIPHTYIDDRLILQLAQGKVSVNGEDVKLTDTEFRLLSYLVRHAGRVVPHEELIEEIWTQDDPSTGKRLLKLYILYLRRKIEKDPNTPDYLKTERGIGYQFKFTGVTQTT